MSVFLGLLSKLLTPQQKKPNYGMDSGTMGGEQLDPSLVQQMPELGGTGPMKSPYTKKIEEGGKGLLDRMPIASKGFAQNISVGNLMDLFKFIAR